MRFSHIRQLAPVCSPSNTCFLGSSRVHNPNGISLGSAVFAQFTTESPCTLQWAAPFPSQNCLLAEGDLYSHLIRSSLGPPESTIQTVSRSVHPFLQDSRSWQTDRQTDRQTDHATPPAATGRIYVELRCGLKLANLTKLTERKSTWTWRIAVTSSTLDWNCWYFTEAYFCRSYTASQL